MKSLIDLLKWIQDNWASIVTVVVLALGIYERAKKFWNDWKAKTEEEKKQAEKEVFDKAVETAKKALADYILILVSKAEIDWQSEDGKLGQTKRAQVIEQIYDKYPVLEQVQDKDELLAYIDSLITEALKIVRKEIRSELKGEENGNTSTTAE